MNPTHIEILLVGLFQRRMSIDAAEAKYEALSVEEAEFFLLNLSHCAAHGDWEGDFALYQQYKAELEAYFAKEMDASTPTLMHSVKVIANPTGEPLFYDDKRDEEGCRIYSEAIVTAHADEHLQVPHLAVCTNPYIPFVEVRGGKLQTSVSGGYFHAVPTDTPQIRRDGTKARLFKRWGTCGATADGMIRASVEVPHWVIDDRECTLGFY
jgi:hypothetical protein